MAESKPVALNVKGMTCQGCVNAVTRIVKKADPEAQITVDLASGHVDGKSAQSAEALAKAITAAGYEAQVRA